MAAAKLSKTTRPTAICPATIGSRSGSSSTTSSPLSGAGMCSCGQNTASNASSIVLSMGSSVTTQAWLTSARSRPESR